MKLSISGLLTLLTVLVSLIASGSRSLAVESDGADAEKNTARKGRRVTVILGGVTDDDRARRLRRALRQVEGVRFRAKQLEAGAKPRYFSRLVVRIEDLEKTPIGALAKAVVEADLPGREEVEPTVNLALFTSEKISEESVMALRAQLAGVPGIAPEVPGGVGALIDERLYWVRLDNTGEARLKSILKAARRAGLGLSLAPRKAKGEDGVGAPGGREAARATALAAKWDGRTSELPEELRGFSGLMRGRLMAKDVEKGTLVLRVDEVRKVWKPSAAKEPQSAVGRYLLVEGIAGKWLDALLLMEPGDTIELETHHKTGRNLSFLGEWLKKVTPEEKKTSAIPEGFRGFRGIFSGELISKDVEKGTLVVKVDRIDRTWKANKAGNPESAFGHALTVKGVSGKWLDVLLVLEVGDRIEVEAFDNGAEHLDFVREWLKKAE